MGDDYNHIKMIHDFADDIDGKLILSGFGEGLAPINEHFQIGNYEAMAKRAEKLSQQQGRNVYTPLAVMRSDLPAGAKGGEQDVVAILGFVVDFDAGRGKDWEKRLPDNIEAQYVLETSPDNAQCFIFFGTPILINSEADRNAAKHLLQKLTFSCDEADPSGAELSHVWRIPDLNNWPNKKKIKEGRDPTPCTVRIMKEWDGSFMALSDIEKLPELVKNSDKKHTDTTKRKPIGNPDLIADDIDTLISALQAIPNDLEYPDWIRLAHAFKAGAGGDDTYYPVFEEWSLQWPDNTPEIVRQKWNSITHAEAGAGTIFFEAKKRGWSFPNVFTRVTPYKTASAILENCFSWNDDRILVYTQDFYLWEDGYYKAIHANQVKKIIAEKLEGAQQWVKEEKKPFNPVKKDIDETFDAIKNKTLVSYKNQHNPPFWIKNDQGLAASEILCVKNGLLHIPSKTLIPHTPDLFTVNGLPYEYDPNAPEPERWLALLQEIWPGDPESIECLQTFMGYLLTPDTSQHKILMITGPARSGKGTISRIITILLGEKNVVSPLIGSFSGHGLQPLIDKTAALINDARPPRSGDTVRNIIETLLTISGEDFISVKRKYKDNWDGCLPVRFILFSNEIPSSLKDPSQALVKRFINLKMTKSFYGKEDHNLLDKLKAEVPGILNWAIEGYDKLQKRGKFVQPQSGKDALDYLKENSNPLSSFIDDCSVIAPEKSIFTEDLRDAYVRYSGDTAMSAQEFGEYLSALYPVITKVRKSRGYAYVGIGLNDNTVSEFFSAQGVPSLEEMMQ